MTDAMTIVHDIMCGKWKTIGKPTTFDLEVANASAVLHYRAMRPIMKAIKNM